ncbi:MAG: undecaprenyl-phosphate glucose phosphotransferase [Gammaproteobacteria bacterium]|nr:undecaprenyl-phosphate glucose phosphotransferase [Gammaproteobacteria bacterium]
MLEGLKHNQARCDVTAVDPSTLFIVKSLLYPVTSVLALYGCLVSLDESLAGPNILLAVLTFIGVAEFLEVPPIQGAQSLTFALRSLVDLALRWALVAGLIQVLLRVCELSAQFDSTLLSRWAVTTPLVLWLAQLGARHVLIHSGKHSPPQRRVVIVGMTELGVSLANMLSGDPLLRTQVLGFFEDRRPGDPARVHADDSYQVLGKSADVPGFVPGADVNAVYIALPMRREPRVLQMLEELRNSTASVYFVPDLVMFQLIQPRFDLVGGIPLLTVQASPFYGIRGAAKRLVDVLVAGTAIVLLAPVLLAVALGIRLSSPGPVVFKQKRYGLDGREILVYKFRSMRVMEDGETRFTQVSRQDPRVTAFGAFTRRTSLDELPQLFNVLQGTMSLVGPRPHVVSMNERYRVLIPSYMLRHKVKPGITGWAQIHGHRGGDDLESMQKRIEFDLQYLRRWSLQLDLVILARTLALVWMDRKAY